MLAALFDITPLLPAIENAALILTPNSRLKNKILESYGRHCQQQGQSAWRAPRVCALADWLHETWQTLLDTGCPHCRGTLISAHQRELLWRQIIVATPEGTSLLSPDKLAKQADLAYQNLRLWELPLNCLNQYTDPDYQVFHCWAQAFEKKLEQLELITSETGYSIIADAFAEAWLPREAIIHLLGFDDLAPLLRTLLTAAGEHLLEVEEQGVENARVCRTEAADFERELLSAAHWSRAVLAANAEASIGIIVPNLGQCRTRVERVFTSVFEAHYLLPEVARYTLPFNFSAGVPLGGTPLIQDALQLLSLNRNRWELTALCNLLHSPFFADADNELDLRSRLIQRLRQLGKMSLTGADLRYHSQQIDSDTETNGAAGPALSMRFQQVENQRRQAPRQQLPSRWAELFAAQLQTLGWPGRRRLDSNEYQQASHWYQLLEQFAGLDATGLTLTLDTALRELHKLAAGTHFQAQVPPSPIQILGALEGAGLQFSHCWVVGLHQHDWPPAPAPHPLLPTELQREHNMPHASSERELRFAQSLTEGYRRCAAQVIFSSPHRDGETELSPSRLIEDLPFTEIEKLVVTEKSATSLFSRQQPAAERSPDSAECLQDYYARLLHSRQLEWVNCGYGPKLENTRTLKGGSAVLQHQAACPFNAFAIHRLGARSPQRPSLGLSAIERGMVLHSALATIWQRLQNRDKLLALAPAELDTLVWEAVGAALDPIQRRRPDLLGPHYCQLERERQARLIQQWLQEEKSRPPFAVLACEKSIDITIGGLHLQLRLDRVDRLYTGEQLLIDYKTGHPKLQHWQGARPEEPQLPLYAVSQRDRVQAVAFAQINARQCQFLGLGELSVEHTGILAPERARNLDLPPQWPVVVTHWHTVLEALAREFERGETPVAYRDLNVQRYYGEYEALNRFPEQAQLEYLWTSRQWPLAEERVA